MSSAGFKVCVCGGAGGIGQPLSMFMSKDPNVKELAIFDLSVAMVPPAGVAADLSHLDKRVKATGYVMPVGEKPIDHTKECLTGCSLVLIPAGMPRKPGQTRDDLFKVNADIAKGLVEACGKYCPEAIVALIVNPVNSIVPAMAELYKKKGLDPLKIVGVTTLDCVRAAKFVGDITGAHPSSINVPVVGGHAGKTILPLFSQDSVASKIEQSKIPNLDVKVQDAGTEVVNAKGGKGSATLSMGYSGARFGSAILDGLAGKRRVECTYVQSDVMPGLAYFTSKVVFGPKGVEEILPVGALNAHETTRMEEVKAALKAEIETGLAYAKTNDLAFPALAKAQSSSLAGKGLQVPAAPKPATKAGKYKVCVCGGAGGIGQPLSMFMSMDPNVKELSVFDLSVAMVPPAGVAADLSHLDKQVKVKGYVMPVGEKPIEHTKDCLSGCDLVLIPAGMPRKPGQTRDDLFKINADIAKGLVEACAKFCPNAIVALIVNPVNSIVPAMAELYKKKGLDPLKIIGVTTLDCVRAAKFVGEITGDDPSSVNVPVVGGHAGKTILPLFSQDASSKKIDKAKIPDLDVKVQDAGTEVVNAKGGKGSATLSMGYSGARFGSAILAGLAGERRTECAYLQSSVMPGFKYFSSKVVFGPKGVEKVLPVGDLSPHESKRMEEAKEALRSEIETGLKYAETNDLAVPAKASSASSPNAQCNPLIIGAAAAAVLLFFLKRK